MSKFYAVILTLCFVNFAYGGVTDLVPGFVKKTAKIMVPEEINNLAQNVFYGPPAPSQELIAAKRFVLEAEMASDESKLNELRIELYKILYANIENPEANNLRFRSVEKSEPKQSLFSSVLNSAMQAVQPKVTMQMQPKLEFGN